MEAINTILVGANNVAADKPIGAVRVVFVKDYNAPTTATDRKGAVWQTGDFGYALQQRKEEGWVNKKLLLNDSKFGDEGHEYLRTMYEGLSLTKF